MKKPTLTFGILAGLLTVLYSVAIMLWMGGDITPEKFAVAEALGFLRYLILLLTIFFALWTLRKKSTEGLPFGRLVKEGLMVTIVVALFVGAMEAIYILVNPEFMNQAQEVYMDRLIAEGATATEIAEMKAQMEDFAWLQNPILSGIFYFVEMFLIGLAASLLMALFMKGKKGGGTPTVAGA